MREALFIKKNSAKWKQYENIDGHDVDELAEKFITVTDDLAFAKTFYPNSKTTAYLNNLAAGFHQSIYKNKKEKTGRFISFWKTELPLLFHQYRKELLFSFIFFVTFLFIGALSAKYDDTFVRFIMGNEYVNMTNANIAKGDPFGVYKSKNEFAMFYQIVKNNLYVTVVNYLAGILLSVGTIYVLFKNGVMLGAFEYFFFSKDLGLQSILVIWIHGTLEISSIIIAGGAGLVFGNSIIFPKTYTRFLSFKRGAKDGMKITVGVLPLIVIAGVFESFVTRHTEMPTWLSVFILGTSFLFILVYVVIYPIRLSKSLKK